MLLRFSRPFKYTVYSVLMLILIYTGAYAALYRASDPALIRAAASEYFQEERRSLNFAPDIRRRLFPRPTVILNSLTLSRPDSTDTAFAAEEIRIGFAWRSLFGPPAIEKLVIQKPELSVRQLPDGHWDINDLLKRAQGADGLAVNRIQMENGRLNISWADQSHSLQHISVRSGSQDGARHYLVSGQAGENPFGSLTFTARGVIKARKDGFELPDIQADFSGTEHGRAFSGSLKTRALWQAHEFAMDDIGIQVQSARDNAAVSIGAAKLAAVPGRTQLSRLSIVADARRGQNLLHSTVKAADTVWQNGILSIDSLRVDGEWRERIGADPLTLNLNGRLYWQPAQNSLSLDPLKLTTLNNAANDPYASEWEGSLSRGADQGWQLALKGLYQRQPAHLDLQQRDNQFKGSLNLAKLDLGSRRANQTSADSLPALPQLPEPYTADVKVHIGTLTLAPDWDIHNVDTRIRADHTATQLNPLSAEVYSGTSSGSLRIEHTNPPTLHLKQQLKNVQLRPLLERIASTGRIAGTGKADLDLRAQGSNRKELAASLNGKMDFQVKDGEWLGISFYNLIKTIFGLHTPADPGLPSTPFSSFTYTGRIKNGVSTYNIEAELTRPKVHISSKGTGNFSTNTIDSRMLITGYGTEAPLPLRLQGSWDEPDISLDYPKMTSGLTTPEEKQKALSDTLKKQWDWLRSR